MTMALKVTTNKCIIAPFRIPGSTPGMHHLIPDEGSRGEGRGVDTKEASIPTSQNKCNFCASKASQEKNLSKVTLKINEFFISQNINRNLRVKNKNSHVPMSQRKKLNSKTGHKKMKKNKKLPFPHQISYGLSLTPSLGLSLDIPSCKTLTPLFPCHA